MPSLFILKELNKNGTKILIPGVMKRLVDGRAAKSRSLGRLNAPLLSEPRPEILSYRYLVVASPRRDKLRGARAQDAAAYQE